MGLFNFLFGTKPEKKSEDVADEFARALREISIRSTASEEDVKQLLYHQPISLQAVYDFAIQMGRIPISIDEVTIAMKLPSSELKQAVKKHYEKCTCKTALEAFRCTNTACAGWCGYKPNTDMDGSELLEILSTDTADLYNGQYLCLIQPVGFPFFKDLEYFGGHWWNVCATDTEDWTIKAWTRLPDTDVAMNYINDKK